MTNYFANNALRTIQAYARREMAHWYISLEIREDAHRMLVRATGCEIGLIDHRPTVTVDGRPAFRDGDQVAQPLADITWDRMQAWLRGPDDVPDSLIPPTIGSGTAQIVARMGLSVRNALALARVMHHLAYEDGDRTIRLADDTRGRRLHYSRGTNLNWRGGVLTIRMVALPQVLGAALAGCPVEQVVDDPTLEGMTIRMVPTTPRRDNVLQVITTHAGRTVEP